MQREERAQAARAQRDYAAARARREVSVVSERGVVRECFVVVVVLVVVATVAVLTQRQDRRGGAWFVSRARSKALNRRVM